MVGEFAWRSITKSKVDLDFGVFSEVLENLEMVLEKFFDVVGFGHAMPSVCRSVRVRCRS